MTLLSRSVTKFRSDLGRTSAEATDLAADCLGCGGLRRDPVFKRSLSWVTRCRSCGLVQTYPQPTPAELDEIYGSDYYAAFGHDLRLDHSYHALKRSSADAFLRNAETYAGCGRLLDVGSALGDLLIAGKSRGWEVEGLEPNRFAVEQADLHLPGKTLCGNIDEIAVGDLPWPDASFDLITCCDVIEHLRRPDSFLEHARHLLRPGGVVIVTTIDVDCWYSRLLGPRWVHYHRDHLWYFNRRTLGELVRRAGFEIVDVGRARKIFDANYLLSILQASRNFPVVQWSAQQALRLLPQGLLRRQFHMSEGLLLVGRKPAA